MNQLNLAAHRELSARVATVVLGWRDVRLLGDVLVGTPPVGLVPLGDYLADDLAIVPLYSSSVDYLAPIVSLLASREVVVDHVAVGLSTWRARLTRGAGDELARAFGGTPAEAVCRAALVFYGSPP